MQWRKVTLIGVGLLGGSLGRALLRGHWAQEVVGYVRREASIAEAVSRQAITRGTTSLQEAVREANLIVLCTPIAQMAELTAAFLPDVSPGTIITDVGSVKETVVTQLEALCQKNGASFIGSHPMAGAEKMGVLHARAELFQDAICVVTPTPHSAPQDLESIETLWRQVGARVVRMSPQHHDQLVSRSSHLPHVIAAELVHQVLSPGQPAEQASLCANGFRDTTRIASGSPEMWRDITLANRKNLDLAVDGFIRDLQQFQRWLQQGDGASIEKFFAQAKQHRDTWCDQGKSPE